MPITHEFARDIHTREIVWIQDIKKQSTTPLEQRSLLCLDEGCTDFVFPRALKSKKREAHFCHYSHAAERACKRAKNKYGTKESQDHLRCKHWLAANNHRCVYVDFQCTRCLREFGIPGKTGTLEPRIECTVLGSFRVDVGLVDRETGKVLFALEILHTHAVGYEKQRALKQAGIRVVEIKTRTIKRAMNRKKKGRIWLNHRDTRRKDVKCPECEAELKQKEMHDWNVSQTALECWGLSEEYERWYEGETILFWTDHLQSEEEKRARRIKSRLESEEEKAFSRKKAEYQSVGFRQAEARSEVDLTRNNTGDKRYVKGESFKCEGCGCWWLKKAMRAALYRNIMSYTEFMNRICERKVYQSGERALPRDGYQEWIAHICPDCAWECPACSRSNCWQMLGKYGCCIKCNTQSRHLW